MTPPLFDALLRVEAALRLRPIEVGDIVVIPGSARPARRYRVVGVQGAQVLVEPLRWWERAFWWLRT